MGGGPVEAARAHERVAHELGLGRDLRRIVDVLELAAAAFAEVLAARDHAAGAWREDLGDLRARELLLDRG
jgi:hypothetical protein